MTQEPASRRAAILLLFLFGMLPYVSTIKWPPIASFWAEWAAAILAAAAAIWLSPRRIGAASKARLPLSALVCLAGALIVSVQLAARVPHFKGPALLAVAELTLAAIVCTAAARLRARGPISRELEALALGMVVALLFNGIEVLAERNGWQIYLYRFIPREGGGDRALGLFGQPNQLAVFTAMAWCAAQYLWMRGRLSGFVLVGVAAVVGVNDAGAVSRAGVILFVMATLLGALAMRQHARRKAGQRWLLAGFAVFLALQGWWAATTTESVTTSVMRTDSALRIELLRDAFALAAHHPFVGVGFGNFSAARWQELAWPMGEPVSGHAHNVIAQIAAEMGIAAALLILLPAAFVVLKGLRDAVRRSATPEQFFVGGILLVLSGYSLTEYPLWYTFFLFPFAFLLGLVEQPGVSVRPVQTQYMNVLRRGTWVLAFAGALGLAWDYRRIEALYVDATIQQQAVTDHSQPTLELPTPEIRKISLLTVFDQYADLMLARTLAPNGRLMADKLPITERVMLAFPNWENIYRHAAFLVAAGKPDEALAVWAKTERNDEMRRDTYAALQRQAPNVSGLPAFLARLPKPVAPSTPP